MKTIFRRKFTINMTRTNCILTLFIIIGSHNSVHAQEKSKQKIIKAKIIQLMDPGRPDDIILATGYWPTNSISPSQGVAIEIAQVVNEKIADNSITWQRIIPSQVTKNTIKFVIPKNWPMSIYACRVVPVVGKSYFEASETVLLNAPDPWWLQGNNGALSASPGGWLRIFGKSLYFENTSQVKLEYRGKSTIIKAKENGKGGYALTVNLPVDLALGNYKVSVSNDLGGMEIWKTAGHIQIDSLTKLKQNIFDVTKYNKPANGKLGSWSGAIKLALEAARSNGGGVLYFPRGRYILDEELKIPQFITLRGEGEGLVNLYWQPRENAVASLISGTDNFAIEDIALYTDGNHKNVITGRHNIRIQHVRIRANAYLNKNSAGTSNANKKSLGLPSATGAGIYITGNNANITDCDIYHSSLAILMSHTNGGIIARNQLNYGNGPMQLMGLSRVIIEDNECTGASPWASGIGISLYSACASYHIYFANNKMQQTYGGDREAITTDGHGTAYFGKITDAQDTLVTLADDSWWGSDNKDMIKQTDLQAGIDLRLPDKAGPFAGEEWHGLTMYILSGKGAGQFRNILTCNGKKVSIETPWEVVPDSSSIVSIGKFQGKILFIANEFRDAGTSVQLYAPNCNCIVAENRSWRAQSMNCSANTSFSSSTPIQFGQKRPIIRVEPSWYNQFLNNHFLEGNSWGNGFSTLSIYTNNSTEIYNKLLPENLIISFAHILRGNALDNNTTINIQGNVKDIVIERNKIQNVDQGIQIGKQNTTVNTTSPLNGILIKNNTFLNVNK